MCKRCLSCYEPLTKGETDYHTKCSQKIFGTRQAPLLPYNHDTINELAEQVVRSQTTLTGVQPKLSLNIDKMSAAPTRFTIVGLWGRFILKPQSDAFPLLPETEDLTMHLAELTKIETVPHALIRFSDGELCYITRRIDRTATGVAIPMEDMCQLSERLTEDKYKSSYERIAKLILQYSAAPKLDLVKFWEQVIFSWIVGNADMHLKNYSLYAPDLIDYMLTPAYDLLSTALVMPEDTEELALTLGGKKRKLSRMHFSDAMRQSGLSEKVCDNIFLKFQGAREKWDTCIRKSFLPPDRQEAYMDLIHKRLDRLMA